MIYLDNSATTRPKEVALKAYQNYAEHFGNASSQYEIGEDNRQLIENARRKIAGCINAEPEQIFFTSGGTESDNWAVISGSIACKWMVSSIEHPAMRNSVANNGVYRSVRIPVDEYGYVNLNTFEKLIANTSTEFIPVCISAMLANNETGAIQPIKEMVEIAKKYKAECFHTDAVQAIGHILIDVKDLGVDMMSASGHKFGAFPGVGFLYAKHPEALQPLMYGGHQENGLRGGTYNVPGIVGMADALIESQVEMASDRCSKLRNMCIELMNENVDGFKLNTNLYKSLPHVLNFTINNVKAEELVSYLDLNEIYVSSGSACTSGENKPSHVLMAMGRSEEEANSSIRVSLSSDITEHDIRMFVMTLADGIKLLRR